MAILDSVTDGSVFVDGEAFADDERWHATVATFRRDSPLLRVEADGWPPFWAVTRHADIVEIERRHDVFKNTVMAPFQSLAVLDALEKNSAQIEMLVQMDDPKHKKYRGLTTDWFKPSALRQTMADKVTSLTRIYIEKMIQFDGECDFASDIAKYYPLRVIMAILGLPEDDEPLMLELSTRLLAPEDPEFALSEDHASDNATLMLQAFAFFQAIAAARREHPTADLATVIANSTIDGEPIGVLETLSYFLILITAGHDSSSNTISAGLEALIRNPDQMDLLRGNPDLLPNAIEEMVRWGSPVKQFSRTATQDYEMHSTTIRAGELVLLSFASGNRDETVFEDPFTFDIQRKNANRHVGYGFGKHFCLGAPLARMELTSFFSQFLDRVESVEINGRVERTRGTIVNGIKHMPIRYRFKA